MTSTSDPSKPTPPNTPTDSKDNDTPVVQQNLKRVAKIVAIVFLYKLVEGLVGGFHAALALPANQNLLNLGPFWQSIALFGANGGADGVLEAFRLGLLYWAGPDLLSIVGPVIGYVWRAAANAIRIISRAVQGKDENDTPPSNKK